MDKLYCSGFKILIQFKIIRKHSKVPLKRNIKKILTKLINLKYLYLKYQKKFLYKYLYLNLDINSKI